MSKEVSAHYSTVIIFLLLQLFSFTCNGQVISGLIVDNSNDQSLAYVNIGVVGKNVGTVSSNDGSFSIELLENVDQDTIRISMIGYHSLEYKVVDFKEIISNDSTIYLDAKSFDIDEVVIKGRKLKTKILGNKTTSRMISGGFESDELGSEVGVPIKVKRTPTYIKKFYASIVENKYDTLKFRLNLYSLKNKMPDKSLLHENIIIISTIKKGLLEVDLSKFNIVVEDNFFVSLEWIEDLGKDGLAFSMSLFGNPVIHRKTSHGNWDKIGAVGIGFAVEVAY